ncbi:10-hydroxy-9-(phosphonooxy)octadecanoate phosphatase [Aureococcus anophagefferens]|nr:10-hydroxy-9-(phosphonooxy)octadecanoate phosphatase [Aureococcus anophagefferens]
MEPKRGPGAREKRKRAVVDYAAFDEGLGTEKPSTLSRWVPTLASVECLPAEAFVMRSQDQSSVENWSLADWARYWHAPVREDTLNVISLEFSRTPLAAHTQYYCLMSTGGCYTDFHVDFGGTAVWYHVFRGSKVFYAAHLAAYERWICDADQDSTWFPDVAAAGGPCACARVEVRAGETFFIPSGWIHAVHTPADSLVFGGNFLPGLCTADLQLAVHDIEARTHVKQEYRFPFFVPCMFWGVKCALDRLNERPDGLGSHERRGLAALTDVSSLVRAALVAEASYCATTLPPSLEAINISAIIEVQHERAIVGYDAQNHSLFVSFRGTSNVENWLENVDGFKTPPYEDDSTPRSWRHRRRRVRDAVRRRRLAAPPVALTDAFSFGSPRLGNAAFAAYFEKVRDAAGARSYRVTRRDVIPHLPQRLLNFLHVPGELWQANDTVAVACSDSASAEDPNCSDACAPLGCTSKADHLRYLGVPLGKHGAPVCVALKTKAGINFVIHGDRNASVRAIFLQGVAASLDNNRFLLAALRRGGDVSDVCVVAVDAVGIGGSVAPLDAREYSVARSASDVRDVLEIVNWSRAHVVGHSMGGMVAMEFAASHPDRVASLALLSTTAHRRALDYVPRAAAVPNGLRLLSARSPADRARVDVAFHFSRHFLFAPNPCPGAVRVPTKATVQGDASPSRVLAIPGY